MIQRNLLTALLTLTVMSTTAFAQFPGGGRRGDRNKKDDRNGSNTVTMDENEGLSACEDNSHINNAPPKQSVDQVIQAFAAKEKEFQQARDQYTYRQDWKVQGLDGNTVEGEYREVFDVQFTDAGKRMEDVVFAPQSTLDNAGLILTKEDLDDLRHRYPFVLTTDDLPNYQVLYVGQEHVDELDTYVFDVAPKTIEKDKRYFQGRIWVDQQDLQIVKSCGRPAYQKTKANQEQRFPAFTTYREQIDGRYWFPTYSKADEVLHFKNSDVHIKIVVKYQDYKRFQSKSRIIFNGEVQEPDQQQPQQQQPPDQKPK